MRSTWRLPPSSKESGPYMLFAVGFHPEKHLGSTDIAVFERFVVAGFAEIDLNVSEFVKAHVARISHVPSRLGDIMREGIANLVCDRCKLIYLRDDGISERHICFLPTAVKGDCCSAKHNREVVLKGNNQFPGRGEHLIRKH